MNTSTSPDRTTAKANNEWPILLGLMAPPVMMGVYSAMFNVVVPTIRDEFAIESDMAAWVVAIYSLPFMMFMPLHGRLADAYGKRRILLLGTAIFIVGTVIAALGPSLGWLMVGRAIQGAGSAGFTPLALAIIAQIFPAGERGKLMGTWNIAYPITGIIGPVLGGILIDSVGWRVIFWPTVVIGLIAYWVTRRQVPELPGFADEDYLRRFDWGGVLLLSAGATFLLFYVSSRSVTGVENLRDWRLLALTLLSLGGLVWWEQQRAEPFIPIELFGELQFSLASILAGIRMFTMNALRFLVALYVVDIHQLDATTTGLIITLHAVPLFLFLRLGGQLADRWGSRRPVVASMAIQAAALAYLALLPADVAVWWVLIGVLGQSSGASLSLAPLHRASMVGIAEAQTGVAAGVYSMVRFAGALLGTSLSGVLLQQALARESLQLVAYQQVFWVVAAIVAVGAGIGVLLRERKVI
ncbi:MAG: MFS transporter [Caldilineaceae bacterium]|nr:MFS transporter [Caldilineaceae bacterium]